MSQIGQISFLAQEGALLGPSTEILVPHKLRLRLHGLIERLPRSNVYTLTPDGIRVTLFYTKVHDRLLRPLLAADHPPASLELRRALRTIDQAVDDYVANARIKPAA